jgi:ectoine hydroxylase-related dioxygenase (phytanoyl-CoA dioxygenase family)
MNHEPERWKNAYDEDGFVIVPDLLDAPTLSALRKGVDKITATVHSLPPHLKKRIFFESEHVTNNSRWYSGTLTPEECGNCVRQIADIAIFDPVFVQLICYPPLLDVLEVLFQSTEFSFTFMVGRPKPARVGNGVRNGAFHRDTPDQDYTSANAIQSFLCLDDMRPDNGPTMLIRGSQKVSDEEAKQPRWISVDPQGIEPKDRVVVSCPAGSGLFFTSKIIHAAGHNRSGSDRRTINIEWAGPDVLSTSPTRFSYQGLRPRSKDPIFQKQMRMTFPQSLEKYSPRGSFPEKCEGDHFFLQNL